MVPEIKKSVSRRLNIIRGQIDGLLKAVEEEQYCADILLQSLAVQNALKQVDTKLLESHLKTCITKQISTGDKKKAVEELTKIYQLSRKNS